MVCKQNKSLLFNITSLTCIHRRDMRYKTYRPISSRRDPHNFLGSRPSCAPRLKPPERLAMETPLYIDGSVERLMHSLPLMTTVCSSHQPSHPSGSRRHPPADNSSGFLLCPPQLSSSSSSSSWRGQGMMNEVDPAGYWRRTPQ